MNMQAPTNNRGDGSCPAFPRWRQRVGGKTGINAVIEALNADPAAVFAGARIDADALDDAENWIGYDAFGRLLEVASRLADYPHFGLTAGRMWHVEEFGVLGELVRHSPTAAEALQALTLHQHLQGEGGVIFSARQGSLIEVGYAIYYPNVPGADQIYDFALATLFNLMRSLCGPCWIPAQVLIPHARPHDPVHYRNLFKVHPQFASEVCALRFPAHWLDRSIQGADPQRRAKALAQVHGKDDADLVQQVYRALRNALLEGSSSGDDVARALGMHRRTLNRRLRDSGTTFQYVLDDVRCEAARQLLCYSGVALDDIAASLAYAGVSPFMRSFRRWTGLPPGRVRRLGVDGAGGIGGAPAEVLHTVPIDAGGLADATVGAAGADPTNAATGVGNLAPRAAAALHGRPTGSDPSGRVLRWRMQGALSAQAAGD